MGSNREKVPQEKRETGSSRGACPDCAANRVYNQVMTNQALELLQKALTLPEEERTELVRSLIESLEEVFDKGVERAWDEEIARRIADLDSGRTKTVSWEEVRKRISARLAHDARS
jgi:putative addiction module component (TIGR02574 family)